MMQTDKLYFDRDLDRLAFNVRVVQVVEENDNPLCAHLTFLAIFSSNLDEFFRVRVSKLRQIGKLKKSVRKPLALKPNKTLKAILKKVDEQQERLGKVYSNGIIPGLNKYGIEIVEFFNSSDVQKAYLADYLHEKIKPLVEMMDSKSFTQNYFKDGAISFVVCFKGSEDLSFLSVPNNELGRFLKLPAEMGCYRVKIEQIVVNLFRVMLRWNFAKIQRDGCYMAGIITESTWASVQNSNGTLKTVQQSKESGNFSFGLIDELLSASTLFFL